MAFYNPDTEIELIVDGSPTCLSAILSQKQPDGNFRPVIHQVAPVHSVQFNSSTSRQSKKL